MYLPRIMAMGVYDSKIIEPNTVISKNRKTSMFEIELPVEDGGVSYINSTSKPIKTDMIICAKPGQIRHSKFPFKCYYIHMIVGEGVLYDILMKAPVFLETEKFHIYKKLFSEMLSHYNTFNEKEEVIIYSKLLELIYTIENDSKIQLNIKHSNNNAVIIEKTFQYIEEHIAEDLSLENLAKINSLSKINFHNIFKKATEKTLRRYVEEQRIKKAINLLLTTNYNLTEIAYDCGFSSQSYFSYAFKRKMKCTPREYIRKIYDKYEM